MRLFSGCLTLALMVAAAPNASAQSTPTYEPPATVAPSAGSSNPNADQIRAGNAATAQRVVRHRRHSPDDVETARLNREEVQQLKALRR